MSRLFDRMMRQMQPPDAIVSIANRLPIIVGDDVAAYYFHDSGHTSWSLAEDFPNLAPPLPMFFLDFKAPKQALYADDGEKPWDGVPAWGVTCRGIDWDVATRCDAFRNHPPLLGVRWILELTLVVEKSNGHIALAGQKSYFLDAAGQVLWLDAGNDLMASTGRFYPGDINPEDYAAGCNYLLQAALMTICFMHCRNVVQKVVKPEEWQIRRARKHKQRPPVTYRMLEIEPMKHVLRTEGDIKHNGLQRALHICRGHFATYDEKPLFGKVRGTFWQPAHVRGSLSAGLALKDYAVKAPKGITQ